MHAKQASGDLSVTALYTCATWAWAGLPAAELFDHADARRVFGATNLLLACARPFFARPPSLKHSLVQRHVMIDRLLEESNARAVLELGAGLSRRGAAFTAKDRKLDYVELDRPHVMAKKRALAERSPAGRAALAHARWRLVGGDVADTSFPDLLASVPDRVPLFVIAEGLLMYLDASAQRVLWERVRELFAARDGMFVFDLVPAVEQARSGAIGRGLEWTMKRFTGGHGFERDQRTRHEIRQELEAAGFRVELFEPASAPSRWQLPFAHVQTQQLLFVARPRR
jgi:O-methyltransferase involved in polyketide biosynthesis